MVAQELPGGRSKLLGLGFESRTLFLPAGQSDFGHLRRPWNFPTRLTLPGTNAAFVSTHAGRLVADSRRFGAVFRTECVFWHEPKHPATVRRAVELRYPARDRRWHRDRGSLCR